MPSTIIYCGCRSDSHGNTKTAKAQDTHYGTGRRVANYMNNKGDNKQARCTVCGQSKTGNFSTFHD